MTVSRSRSWKVFAAAISAPVVLSLAACSSSANNNATKTSPRPGNVVLAMALPSQGFEGDKCITDLQTNPMVYDSLLRIQTPEGKGVVPGLAASYTYDDKALAYEFTLRPDAKFNNGQQLTADDVVFSIDQWKAGQVSGIYYGNVKSATAVSPSVVKVQMNAPDNFLPALLTWCTSTIYPKDFGDLTKEAYFQKPISAGAFAVDSVSDLTGPNEVLNFVPNKYYYGYAGKTAPFTTFKVKTISDPSQRVLQFKAGDVDILDQVDSAAEAQVGSSVVSRSTPNRINGMLLNLKSGPTADPDLRAAISLALDRSAIVQAQNDGTVAATGALPIKVPGAVEPTTPYASSANLDQAKAAIAKSKYASGVTLTYLYVSSDKDSSTMAQVAKDQLSKIGVTLTLQAVDNTTLQSRSAASDFQIIYFAASAISPTIFDPIGFMQAAAYPWSGANPAVVNEAMAKGTSTNVAAEQEAQARKVQDDILSQNFFVGVYNNPYAWAVQPWVTGFTPLQYGLFYADDVTSK